MLYRKKPVVIEAFRFTTDSDVIAPDWFTQAVIDRKISIRRRLVDGSMRIIGCVVRTLEGKMEAHPGDYIIRGVKDELYPCKADIFEETYERVS